MREGESDTDGPTPCRRYAFLFNEKIPEEVRDLKAQLKSEKDGGARKRIQARMTRLQQSVRLEQDRRIDDEVRTAVPPYHGSAPSNMPSARPLLLLS